MDRDEKIARLETWLEDNDPTLRGKAYKGHVIDSELWKREVRKFEALRHELQRQIDKKIIEELGLFDE